MRDEISSLAPPLTQWSSRLHNEQSLEQRRPSPVPAMLQTHSFRNFIARLTRWTHELLSLPRNYRI
jgi:hypothetical protein